MPRFGVFDYDYAFSFLCRFRESNMEYARVPALIAKICSDEATSFKERTELLFDELNILDRDAVVAHIEYGGVIPESYSHDSSEEKLFAKYCDYLLANSV